MEFLTYFAFCLFASTASAFPAEKTSSSSSSSAAADGGANSDALVRILRSPLDSDAEEFDAQQELAAALATAARDEPAQCVKRLICDLATGQMGHQDDGLLMTIKSDNDANPPSDMSMDFRPAIMNGHLFGSMGRCEVRYKCPFSGRELLALAGSI